MGAICPRHGTVRGTQKIKGIEGPEPIVSVFESFWSVGDSGEEAAVSGSDGKTKLKIKIPLGQPLYTTHRHTYTLAMT